MGLGFYMSVQASRDHYSVPRNDLGPYTHVEVAGPSECEDLLLPYRDKSEPAICGMRPMMYERVPARVIRQVISKHTGMTKYSGRLPRMVEVDEDGCQWAEAAVSPSDSDPGSSGAEADDEDDGADSPMGPPTSAAHLGSPSPIPPPLPTIQTTGALTPPPQLMNVTMSPIATAQERLNFE